tara:strand:- start:554 stop:1408 length:855 start_codon:yes stop_codon:yes gene_type:complete
MTFKDFILSANNWSGAWLISLLIVFCSMWYFTRVKGIKLFFVALFIGLIYVIAGSPLMRLHEYGLQSAAMIQQVVVLMIAPVFIWYAISGTNLSRQNGSRNTTRYTLFYWFTGTFAMWIAHFINAKKAAVVTGMSICGVDSSSNIWIAQIPDEAVLLFLLISGILFFMPIFNNNKRINPLAQIIYLFTSCVSCSILGLWVAFSASISPYGLASITHPVTISLQQDQELAGMIMWVPGCILYVSMSCYIAIQWLEGKNHIPENLPVIEKKRGITAENQQAVITNT